MLSDVCSKGLILVFHCVSDSTVSVKIVICEEGPVVEDEVSVDSTTGNDSWVGPHLPDSA